jgi:hypothetical protein
MLGPPRYYLPDSGLLMAGAASAGFGTEPYPAIMFSLLFLIFLFHQGLISWNSASPVNTRVLPF